MPAGPIRIALAGGNRMTTTPTLWAPLFQANITDRGFFQGNAKAVPIPYSAGAVVVWYDESNFYNPSGTSIVGRFFLVDEDSDEISLPSAFKDGGHYLDPSIAYAAGSGYAVAFRERLSQFDSDVYVAFYDEEGTFTISSAIDNLPFNNTLDPQIAALTSGNYVVAVSFNNSTALRYAYTNGTVSQPGLFVAFPSATGPTEHARVAALRSQSFVVVSAMAANGDDNNHDIVFSIFHDQQTTAALGTVPVPTGNGSEDETSPVIAALTGGGFALAWEDDDASGRGIRFAVYSAGGSLSATGPGNATTSGDQFDPVITALQDGGFVILWDEASRVVGQRFSKLGSRVGNEFVVATGAPDLEDATVLSDGRILITLSSLSSGGSEVLLSIWDPRNKTIDGTSASEVLTSRVDGATVHGLGGDDALIGQRSADDLWGDSGRDYLYGGPGNDDLDGGTGADHLEGGSGNDTYYVDNSKDVLVEVSGHDLVVSTISFTLRTGFEDLILTGKSAINGTGNSSANEIAGNKANNILKGGGGGDDITGNGGRDKMTGGTGADDFDFDKVTDSGKTKSTRDIITDFKHGIDTLDIEAIDANGSAKGHGRFKFVAKEGAKFTGVKGQLIWDQQDNPGKSRDMTIVSADINGDKKVDFQIELTGLVKLTIGDFDLS